MPLAAPKPPTTMCSPPPVPPTLGRKSSSFPTGFQTVVGERGVTLSGGQKQRSAIARALLKDPRILILDDALASVDTYTEEQILTGLRAAMQGRTTLLIAHRASTARNADRIAVLIPRTHRRTRLP